MYRIEHVQKGNYEAAFLHYGNGNYTSSLNLKNLDMLTKPNLYALMKNIKSMITHDEWQDFKGHVYGMKSKEAYNKANGNYRKEVMGMKKATFEVGNFADKKVETRTGYTFEAHGRKIGLCKQTNRQTCWYAYDLKTGRTVTDGYVTAWSTRKDAYAYVISEKCKELFEHISKTTLKNMEDEFKRMHPEAPSEKKRTTKKKPMNTRKKTTKKHEPFMIRVQNGKVEGVEFMQKNEKSCLWITGKTSAYKDELMKEGFKYSAKKKAWWKRPETWAA